MNCTQLDIPSWSSALFLPKSKGSFGAPRTIGGIGWGLYGFHAGLRVWVTAVEPAQEQRDEGPPSTPRSSPVHPACHSGSFSGLKAEKACRQYSEGWWVPQVCPGTWWHFMATGLEYLKLGQCMRCRPGKVLQAEHEVIRVHQEAREAAGRLVLCWGSEELEEEKCKSPARCQLVSGHIRCSCGHRQSPCSKSPTGLLLRARMPKGLCLHGGDKSHQWEHRQTLGEFW